MFIYRGSKESSLHLTITAATPTFSLTYSNLLKLCLVKMQPDTAVYHRLKYALKFLADLCALLNLPVRILQCIICISCLLKLLCGIGFQKLFNFTLLKTISRQVIRNSNQNLLNILFQFPTYSSNKRSINCNPQCNHVHSSTQSGVKEHAIWDN